VATLVPFFVTTISLLAFSVIGTEVGFFPEISLPYDWIVLVATYIIWGIAIYVITVKIMGKVRKMIAKKKNAGAHK
jgi:uncharacterized membrane protein